MSSTNKTENLHLNKWIGSDKPKRLDFNYDNEVIDRVISDHMEDSTAHVTAAERDKWNSFIHIGSYYGNGNATRTINHGCPFDICFGIIFADSRESGVADFANSRNRSYFAVFTKGAHQLGVSINNDNVLTVKQSASAEYGSSYAGFNELGVTYRYVLFRDMDSVG